MENKVENLKAQIEERLKELALIQPKKDPLKYLAKCEEAYKAYHIAKGVEHRHKKRGEDFYRIAFEDALNTVEEALKEDF